MDGERKKVFCSSVREYYSSSTPVFFFFFFKLNISCDFTGARTRPHMRTQTAVQFDHTQ